MYLPRAIYASITLINRLEGLLATLRARNGSGCPPPLLARPGPERAGSGQQPVVDPPAGHGQTASLSSRFRENNVWLAMEDAVQSLAGKAPPVPLATWPECIGG
jgi:hypothetical protein